MATDYAANRKTQTDDSPLFMGGYREIPGKPSADSRACREWANYVKEKAELDIAIKARKVLVNSAVPKNDPIKQYADMIEAVRQIPDKLTQLKVVNAWVNMKIGNDNEEARAFDRGEPCLSLCEALREGKGLCTTIAKLKVDALERIGFDPKDVRVVSEIGFGFGIEQRQDLAIAYANGEMWALKPDFECRSSASNIASLGNQIDKVEAWNLIIKESQVEPTASHHQVYKKGIFQDEDFNTLHHSPAYCFNSERVNEVELNASAKKIRRDSFCDNVHEAGRYAPHGVVELDHSEVAKDNIWGIMQSALSSHFVIKDAPQAIEYNAPPHRPFAKELKGKTILPVRYAHRAHTP